MKTRCLLVVTTTQKSTSWTSENSLETGFLHLTEMLKMKGPNCGISTTGGTQAPFSVSQRNHYYAIWKMIVIKAAVMEFCIRICVK